MRKALAMLTALASLTAGAQLTASVTTNTTYVSSVVTNRAWAKHIVTEFLSGNNPPELKDLARKFVSTMDLEALGIAVEESSKVYDAWMRGFADGCRQLEDVIGRSPTHGMFLQLLFPLVPSTTRKSVDIFVVSNAYDSAKHRDIMWVYCSRELPLVPVTEVPYIWESGFTTNRVRGTYSPSDVAGAHWTNTVNLVAYGNDYPKCHILYVDRPAALRNVPCRLNPHGLWGHRQFGFDWGPVTVTVEGSPTLTGPVTNDVLGIVRTFSNGGLVGEAPIEGDSQ